MNIDIEEEIEVPVDIGQLQKRKLSRLRKASSKDKENRHGNIRDNEKDVLNHVSRCCYSRYFFRERRCLLYENFEIVTARICSA